jgi:hypothetical protein
MNLLLQGVYAFAQEVKQQVELCECNEQTTAVHTRGKGLQLYRMYKRDKQALDNVRAVSKSLMEWKKHPMFGWEGEKWQRSKQGIEQKIKQHPDQNLILSKGVCHKGTAYYTHVYKVEGDDCFKTEVAPFDEFSNEPERAMPVIAGGIELLDMLLPKGIANALPPYHKHEHAFETISSYLAATLPSDMYNFYFPP